MSLLLPTYGRKCTQRFVNSRVSAYLLILCILTSGIIPLDFVDVRLLSGDYERPWQFEIFNIDDTKDKDMVKGCKLDKTGTVVMGNHKVYRMSAASQEERDSWVSCLDYVIKKVRMDKYLKEKKDRHLNTCVTNL